MVAESLEKKAGIELTFGLATIAIGDEGPVPVATHNLHFLSDAYDIELFLSRSGIFFSMLIGQGDQYFQGLYGPLPVVDHPDFLSLVYTFSLSNPEAIDPRKQDLTYCLILLFFPATLETLFKDRDIHRRAFETSFKELESVSELKDEQFLENLTQKIHNAISSSESEETIKELFKKASLLKESVETPVKEIKKQEIVPSEEKPALSLPLMLHSTAHGMEKAFSDLTGPEFTKVLNRQAERNTLELLEDLGILEKDEDISREEALDIAIDHLRMQGEEVSVTWFDSDSLEPSVNCSLAELVHPGVPVEICLYARYISSILLKALGDDHRLVYEECHMNKEGSTTRIRISKRDITDS